MAGRGEVGGVWKLSDDEVDVRGDGDDTGDGGDEDGWWLIPLPLELGLISVFTRGERDVWN